ncbi:hypothetical protein J3A83DRAFT_4189137 [Scleroderma citrinum]
MTVLPFLFSMGGVASLCQLMLVLDLICGIPQHTLKCLSFRNIQDLAFLSFLLASKICVPLKDLCGSRHHRTESICRKCRGTLSSFVRYGVESKAPVDDIEVWARLFNVLPKFLIHGLSGASCLHSVGQLGMENGGYGSVGYGKPFCSQERKTMWVQMTE